MHPKKFDFQCYFLESWQMVTLDELLPEFIIIDLQSADVVLKWESNDTDF